MGYSWQGPGKDKSGVGVSGVVDEIDHWLAHEFGLPAGARRAAEPAMNYQAESAYVNRIITGDCLDVLSSLPAGVAQLFMFSPPYPGHRECKLSVVAWIEWIDRRLREMYRVLDPVRGVLAMNVMFGQDEAGWFDTRLFMAIPYLLHRQGFGVADVFIWTKKNPVPAGDLSRRDIPAWEPVFVAARSLDYAFNEVFKEYHPKTINKNKPGNRARAAGVGHSYLGGLPGLNPKGARLTNVLDLSPSGGPPRPRAIGGSYPYELPLRLIEEFSNEGDLVIDPFTGVGTTCMAAKDLGRRWLGVEVDEGEADVARDWLAGRWRPATKGKENGIG